MLSRVFLNRVKWRSSAILQHSFVSARGEPNPATASEEKLSQVEEFRVYEIPGLKRQTRKERKKLRRRAVLPPRCLQMPVDQDWTKVWPAAASFKYSVVPFPVRQGFIKNNDENAGVIPAKYANAELMKIPNFLHLTPAHIAKHCAALKQFCTELPMNLTSEKLSTEFPVSVTSYSYCFSGSSIRHPKARVVKVQFSLDALGLDSHGRDKFVSLLGDKYNIKTGKAIIEADCCPVKVQNYEYIRYLITALYYEAQKIEPWESERDESTWERLPWEKSNSYKTLLNILRHNKKTNEATKILRDIELDCSDEKIVSLPEVQKYKEAFQEMKEGEDSVTIRNYKNAVLELLGFKKY